MSAPVPVSPLLAFFLCVSGVKLRFCMMRTGVRAAPLLLGEMSLGVQDEGEGLWVPSGLTALNRHTSTSLQVRRRSHTHIHTHTRTHTHTHIHSHSFSLFNPDSSYTHTHSPPWCQHPLWSRFLDDVVKQLHGLHDIFILDRETRGLDKVTKKIHTWEKEN